MNYEIKERLKCLPNDTPETGEPKIFKSLDQFVDIFNRLRGYMTTIDQQLEMKVFVRNFLRSFVLELVLTLSCSDDFESY